VIGWHHMHDGSLPKLRRNPVISHFTAPAPSEKIRRQLPCHWGDGLDSGTIYEIGYARALNKPVIFYAENESVQDKKMIEGSNCYITDDYVSAIYHTVWEAIVL
ncbi:nucleoside 2-deoxyribosyltransferase, partial [Aeromonas veronii]|uniref:nucleoside 2-deoxyribosyltransferase n=1 Tax=Aeromonas veronii TaxID=654 RepID=UPI001F270E20